MKRLVVLAALAGCSRVEISDLELDLTEDGFSCSAQPFLTVRSISVEAIGWTDAGPCRLDRRCLNIDGGNSVEGVDQALAAASQPLLDVDATRLIEIRISGYGPIGCAESRSMCGAADVTSAEDGLLPVPIVCDSLLFPDTCGDETPPPCP